MIFECVWEKQITNAMNNKNTYKHIEKLFVFKKNYLISTNQRLMDVCLWMINKKEATAFLPLIN